MGWVLPILPGGQGMVGWAQQEKLSLEEVGGGRLDPASPCLRY